MSEILVFSTHINNRLLFVLDFIFNGSTDIPFKVTDSKTYFGEFIGGKINYGHEVINRDEIQIVPAGLLEGKGHRTIAPTLEWQEATPILFPVEPVGYTTSLPFDIFSAIFFMLSRYEEYHSSAQDMFGRFPAKESLAFKNNFLHLPVVDIWVKDLLAIITTKNPTIILPKKKTKINFTYDIDVAFAYKGRSFKRQLGAIGKDLIHGDFKRQIERFNVLLGLRKDPFDNYGYIAENGINPIFFFLLHDKLSPQDRNIDLKKPLLRSLINRIRQKFPIGTHPSFHSSTKTNLLQWEKEKLQQISGTTIIKSRQHYLRFNWPKTYQQLAQNGILEEYSMGYTQMPGFRAGTCTPFFFFDLEKNEATNMKIFPLCIMESTFRDHIKIPSKEALAYFIQYFEAVKNVQGHFICIWHNDTLSPNKNENDPINFRWLHEEIIRYIHSTEF